MSKKRRLKRFLKDGRTVMVPMDHGVSKPISGLEEIERIIREIDGIVDAIVLHKGVAKSIGYVEEMECALIVHLSASTCLREPNEKVLVGSVEKAIKLGAEGVSIHVNIGSKTERDQLRDLGIVSEVCDDWGMPLLAMVYARGEGLNERDPELVKHCVRIAYELGADVVKTAYTGNVESFSEVVEFAEIPIVIAGGSKKGESEILREVAEAISAGACGVAIGRNVFQHKNPRAMANALRKIVHESLKEVIV
ncbi:MAG: fructose-bisphosphate aldolase [Archaeoglobales archaeon]|nr:MAG: fructose-bisphosphate aldolase [Archaeoglobales archaeon]